MSSDEPRWTPVPPVPGSLEALQAEVASLRAEVDRLRAGQRDRAADDFDRLLRPRRNWRRLLGALLLILACILSPLAIFSVWLRAQVTDTNRYVQNVAPLSHNKDIDAAVAAKITNELFASVDVRALAQQALPPQGQFLAGPLTSGLRTFTQQTAERVFESPQFNKLWKDANRVAHSQVVAIVKGKSGGIVTAKDGRVVLDLGALVARVQTELHANGVNLFDGLKINSTFELVQSKDLARASDWVRYLEAAAVILPVGVIAAFALAIGLSDDRRRTLLHGGLGVAFAMVVMLALLYAGRAIFVDSVAGPDVPHAAAAAFFDTVVRFLRTGLRAGFTAGLVIAAGAWVTSAHVTAVRLRTTCGRLLTGVAAREDWEFGATGVWVAAHKRLLRYTIGIVGALVLVVMKHPGPKGVIVVTLFVLVGAAAVEVVGRAVSAPSDAGTTQPRLFDSA
ncbi:MAG: hypothetical protein JO248_00550 [Acidimicrobiia bacterium]|nr:hypothetical protein [Acidimicrobiia bacterium]